MNNIQSLFTEGTQLTIELDNATWTVKRVNGIYATESKASTLEKAIELLTKKLS